jgi:hypothetical protein
MGRSSVIHNDERPLDGIEAPVHAADDQVLDAELGERVHRIDPVDADRDGGPRPALGAAVGTPTR